MKKLDLNRLKNKVAQLKGEKTTSTRTSIFWTPQLPKGEKEHEYQVYLLPWGPDSDYPFEERWFYYTLGNMKDEKGFSLKDENGRFIQAPLTLKQFGEDDPVEELIRKLWSKEGKEEQEAKQDQEDAKLLFASQTAYIPVIVKGEESLGPRLWKFSSKKVYERLVELFMKHEKYGVLNDPENCRWITVPVVEDPNKKFPMNKKIGNIDPDFDKAPLSEDPAKIKEWLSNIPDLDETLKYQRYDYDSLKKLLLMWAENTSKPAEIDESEGTEAAKPEKTEKAPKKAPPRKNKEQEPLSKEDALKELDDFMNDDDDDSDE
jgi:hypothetical protein